MGNKLALAVITIRRGRWASGAEANRDLVTGEAS